MGSPTCPRRGAACAGTTRHSASTGLHRRHTLPELLRAASTCTSRTFETLRGVSGRSHVSRVRRARQRCCDASDARVAPTHFLHLAGMPGPVSSTSLENLRWWREPQPLSRVCRSRHPRRDAARAPSTIVLRRTTRPRRRSRREHCTASPSMRCAYCSNRWISDVGSDGLGRVFFLYGPTRRLPSRQRRDPVVDRAARGSLLDGTQQRDFMHVPMWRAFAAILQRCHDRSISRRRRCTSAVRRRDSRLTPPGVRPDTVRRHEPSQ